MKNDIKTKWLAALRGGKYEQGRGVLRRSNGEDKFCCLGVLVDVIKPAMWEQNTLNNEWTADSMAGRLTPDFREFVGMNRNSDFETRRLIQMNDGEAHEVDDDNNTVYVEGMEPHSFNEIADYIEENL